MRSSARCAVGLALVMSAGLAACGGTAANDAGLTDTIAADAGTTAPGPPVLTPCPPGWREETDAHGVITCEPWPATGHDDACASDAMHVPGTAGCARIGTACPADGWPADLPAGAHVLYVDDDAAINGDGTAPARALRTIASAVSQAASGTIVAIASGRYDEGLRLPIAGVTLRGACVAGTVITSSVVAGGNAVVTLAAADQHVENLSIVGGVRAGVRIFADGGSVTDVVIADMVGLGLGATARATLTRVAVRRTQIASIDLPGYGVFSEPGGAIVLRESVIEQNAFVSLAADGGALDVADVAVRETRSMPGDFDLGEGISLTNGSSAVLARVVVEGNRLAGLAVTDPGSRLDATDLVVRDTELTLAGTLGVGIAVGAGAVATVSRARFERNHDAAMMAVEPGAQLTAQDFVARDMQPTPDGGGYGASASREAALTLSRGVIDHAGGVGLFGAYSATIDASDLVIRDTVYTPPHADGAGVLGQLDAHIHLSRARIEHATLFGVGALNGAVIALEGVSVEGVAHTDCCPPETASFGLVADFGGTLTASGFSVAGSDVCGVAVGATIGTASSSMDLAHGVIARSPIGACVQADGYDAERLHTDVRFEDVMVPLQATTYSLPAAQP